MKIRALLLLLALTIAGATLAQAQTQVSLGFFHDSLSPHGDWAVSAQFGNVWHPHVAAGWRPYVYGHWVYSDFGWTWLSDEDWGWATYHYGRWYYDPVFGWCWVPGYDWAPAWVDWQWGDGWIGWAPLPPSFGWTGFDLSFGGPIAPQAFVFVQDRFFLDPHVGFRAIDPVRNAVLLRSTRNVTRYTSVNGTVAVRSLPVDQIQRVTGRAVPRYQVVSATTRANPRVQGNRLLVYRPVVSHTAPSHRTAVSRAVGTPPPAPATSRLRSQQRFSSGPAVARVRSVGPTRTVAPARTVTHSPAKANTPAYARTRAVANSRVVTHRPAVAPSRNAARAPAAAHSPAMSHARSVARAPAPARAPAVAHRNVHPSPAVRPQGRPPQAVRTTNRQHAKPTPQPGSGKPPAG